MRALQPLVLLALLVFAVLGFRLVSPSRQLADHELRLADLDNRVADQAGLLDGLGRFACLYTQPHERELLGLGCADLLSSRRR